jgi:Fic family protein
MKTPTPPPNWRKIFEFSSPEEAVEFFKKMAQKEVIDLTHIANYEYMHWDKFRHFRPIPAGTTHEELWAMIAMNRSAQFQPLPLILRDNSALRYWTPPRHQQWLHRIDQDAGGMIGSRSRMVAKDSDDRFLFNSLMEEAIASSQLEGATTTRTIAKQMLRTARNPRNRNEQMIANNYKAILAIREMKNDQLTPEMLCRIQAIITENTLDDPSAAGRFRTESDGNVHVVDTLTGKTLHEPPTADSLGWRLEQLCQFAEQQSKVFVHPVTKAIALHFMIGYIHPFVDGNGRTARALFYWFMLRNGYWIFEYLPISRIVLDAPIRYGRAYLYTETDSCDLTYFNHYNLKVIDRAVVEMHDYFVWQQQQMREAYDAVQFIPDLNHRQIAVASAAIRDPSAEFTISQHAGVHHVTKATARADLIDLETRGVLHKRHDGKRLLFFASAHLKNRLRKGAFRAVPGRRDVTAATDGPPSDEAPEVGPDQKSFLGS